MLAIKLRRIGKKHQPSYRLVIAEKRSKLDGRYVEDIGWYNPLNKSRMIMKERVLHWIKMGAKPTDSVHNLLVTEGVIDAKKRAVHAKSKKKEEEKATSEAEIQKEGSGGEAPKPEGVIEDEGQEKAPATEVNPSDVKNETSNDEVKEVSVSDEVKKEEERQDVPAVEETSKETAKTE